jgi:hypothetical protein
MTPEEVYTMWQIFGWIFLGGVSLGFCVSNAWLIWVGKPPTCCGFPFYFGVFPLKSRVEAMGKKNKDKAGDVERNLPFITSGAPFSNTRMHPT